MIQRVLGALTAAVGIDPVMRKEFYGLSRRWQTFAGRTIYVALLAGAVWLMWITMARQGVTSYSVYSELGRAIFMAFSGIQFALIALSSIGSASDLVAKEVRGKTLGILAITPLSPWRVVTGKWKSAMGTVMITMLSGVPVMALGIYMGGAGAWELLAVTSLTLAMAMAGSALSILFSSFARTAFLGAVASALLVVASPFVPAVLQWMFSEYSDRENVLAYSCWVHPIYSLVMTLASQSGMNMYPITATYSWISATGASLAGALAVLWLAALRVRKLVRMDPRPPLIKRVFERMDRAFEASPLGFRLWRERAGVWDWNPFLWKEIHSRISGKLRYFIRIALGAYVVLAVVLALSAPELVRSELMILAYAILLILYYLACVGIGSGAFTGEKEEKKWDLLLAAPIRPAQVVRAKMAGAWISTGIFALTAFLLCALVTYTRDAPAWYCLPLLAATYAFAQFTISAGLFFSILVEATRKARAFTLAAVFMILAGMPALLAFLEVMTGGLYGYRRWSISEDFVKATNPFIYLEFLEAHYYGSYDSDLAMRFFPYIVVLIALYGTASFLLYALTVAHFRRLAGRGGPFLAGASRD